MREETDGKPQPSPISAEHKVTLREDDLVYRVVKDPERPPDTLLLTGFSGRSSQPGHTRIYLDLLLSAYVDVPDDAILHAEEIARAQSPLGGHYVWIRRDEDLLQRAREAYQRMAQTQQELGAALQQGPSLPAMAAPWPALGNQL